MSDRQRRDHLRAADVDRTYVSEILKKAVDEGRLSLHEYDERLQKTYTARTYGDLDKIILDLPRPSRRTGMQPYRAGQPVSGSGWAPPMQQQQQSKDGTDWLRGLWMAWAIAVSVNVVVWVLVCLSTAEFIYPWPVWVAGPWGAMLLVTTLMRRPRRDQ
ncbi:DUF1707 SHOCT-like domain-containing protein [Virgisporangium ochraceum]|jgi:hypothetical protein|uniref:DUF1707 SHOCT-like domain-containing protein n=1 Tax=Virgisporangium ochraceum TaxID=65505 RepID=UPI001944B956|nr:DUF1707 domain-containing protein [Virgisporangium ochraceum]